jgi:integrase
MVHAGIGRENGTAPDRKAPITADTLRQLVSVQPPTLAGTRNKAILLVGFAGAFRRSELVALNYSDIALWPQRLEIIVRRSKTDQEGKGMKRIIPAIDDAAICPVKAMTDWLVASEIKRGPLFRKVDRWGNIRSKRVTGHAVAVIIKNAALAAGLDRAQFSGHSLRAGFVTQAAGNGVAEWQIQEVTGHKSTTVLRGYIRDEGLGQQEAIRRALGGGK